uniref:LRAT domain-containing protein n=5 Tax=Magallana gigas TaxID=29159 RepID=A0A8W8KG99_MAGGI
MPSMFSCNCVELSKGIHNVKHCNEERVYDLQHLIQLIRSGKIGSASHIRAHRPRALRILWWTFDYSYDHHFLVTEATENKLTIIHYALKRLSRIILLKGVAEIIQDSVDFANDEEILDFDAGVYLVTAENYPQTPQEKSKAVCKARRRLGERQYSVFYNNCDCFVSWTLRGCSYSHQAMNAKGLLLYIGIVTRYCLRTYRALQTFKDCINKLRCLFGE